MIKTETALNESTSALAEADGVCTKKRRRGCTRGGRKHTTDYFTLCGGGGGCVTTHEHASTGPLETPRKKKKTFLQENHLVLYFSEKITTFPQLNSRLMRSPRLQQPFQSRRCCRHSQQPQLSVFGHALHLSGSFFALAHTCSSRPVQDICIYIYTRYFLGRENDSWNGMGHEGRRRRRHFFCNFCQEEKKT